MPSPLELTAFLLAGTVTISGDLFEQCGNEPEAISQELIVLALEAKHRRVEEFNIPLYLRAKRVEKALVWVN